MIFIFSSAVFQDKCNVTQVLLNYIIKLEITDNLVLKGKQRLKILKFISGKDWGADAKTLRNTLTAHPRVWSTRLSCCADNNLYKLDRVQLAATRTITGL